MRTSLAIIICTHNRADSLRRCLASLAVLNWPATADCTVLVVDNASRDATPEVVGEFAGRLPLQYRAEPQPGKWAALNAVLGTIQADLVLLSDDDVEFDRQWASALVAAAQRHPECELFGGRILACWPDGLPPAWMRRHQGGLLAGVVVHYDLGEQERLIDARQAFYGANLALRRSVIEAGYRFPAQLGPRGTERAPHGETGLVRQLLAAGKQALYVPAAIVHHRNGPERATEKWVRAWYKGHGISRVRQARQQPTRLWAGVPPRTWRKWLEAALRYLLARRLRSADAWLRYEIAMATQWGMICEYRRQRRAPRGSDPRRTPAPRFQAPS